MDGIVTSHEKSCALKRTVGRVFLCAASSLIREIHRMVEITCDQFPVACNNGGACNVKLPVSDGFEIFISAKKSVIENWTIKSAHVYFGFWNTACIDSVCCGGGA